jgi:hypothetical protein
MFRKIVAAAAIGGTLSFGGATAASAAPSSSTTQFNCANAPKALARLNSWESKAQTFVTKATAREAKASSAGHTKAANFIKHRISKVERREARRNSLIQSIETACSGATASPTSPTSPASTASTTS